MQVKYSDLEKEKQAIHKKLITYKENEKTQLSNMTTISVFKEQIRTLKQDHATQLESQRITDQEITKRQLRLLQGNHQAGIDTLNSALEKKNQEIVSLRQTHASVVKTLQDEKVELIRLLESEKSFQSEYSEVAESLFKAAKKIKQMAQKRQREDSSEEEESEEESEIMTVATRIKKSTATSNTCNHSNIQRTQPSMSFRPFTNTYHRNKYHFQKHETCWHHERLSFVA